MLFAPTSNLALVSAIVSEPRVWRRMRNDSDVGRWQYSEVVEKAHKAGGILFVLASDPQPIGIFVLCDTLEARFPTAAETYQCLLPRVWGRTEVIARGFLSWVWRETKISRLVARIPSYNRLSLRLTRATGFREIAQSENVGTKNGQTFGIVTLELHRPTE